MQLVAYNEDFYGGRIGHLGCESKLKYIFDSRPLILSTGLYRSDLNLFSRQTVYFRYGEYERILFCAGKPGVKYFT